MKGGTGSGDLTSGELVAAARDRLAGELRELPPWSDPLLWTRLRSRSTSQGVSLGALVHFIRVAIHAHNTYAARDLFVLLLERTEALNGHWATRVVAHTHLHLGAFAVQAREDLRQELTLYLWEQIALRDGEPWELFFQRSLDYAQRHTAAVYLRQRGSTPPTQRGTAERLPALFAHGSPIAGVAAESALDVVPDTGAVKAFSSAELADLRALVLRLPEHERVCVVMRFWQQAPDAEIARALGGVTTRTVRNYLRRAYERLRSWYATAEVSQ